MVKKVSRILFAIFCLTFEPLTALALTVPAHGPLEDFQRHPLTQSEIGDVLAGEFRCAACHTAREQDRFLEKSAPDLSDVGARVSPDYLRRFLASPETTQPGTSMPNMMASVTEAKRDEIAQALTHFLVSQSKSTFQPGLPADADAELGKELFHSVGCVACHSPKELIESDQPNEEDPIETTPVPSPTLPRLGANLDAVANKYSHRSLSDFLYQPTRVRSSGRMPDMKLSTSETHSLAAYLLGEQTQRSEPLQPDARLVDMGKAYFQDLNCAACHKLGDTEPAPKRVALKDADFSRGCLTQTTTNSPRFQFDAMQRDAMVASVKKESVGDTDSVTIAKTLTVFNCVACHVRDNYGGVSKDRNPYFRTTEKNLGDDGRIPPPLTLAGAKLQPVWLKKVLFDGESVRPYMTTRMPQYGETNLRHLPSLLAQTDILEPVDLKIPNPENNDKSIQEREKKLRAGGRELLGDKGLNCIACHNFNGKPSPLNKGMDLMTTYQRLQPAWFNNFLRNPGGYRPRIVMPYSWPGGIAAHQTILDGDTALQIEAIWYYLSLGTSAADPPGIRREETKLTVGSVARVYRGRSSVAGFRGIAVGLPERLNYAFNAETGTLAAIWQGDFIRVDRSGQGSGGFNPSSKPIVLTQDVSFCRLDDGNAAWPLRPVMTKEAPVNPNPLYPKNVGYQFQEYFLDESSTPTFCYRSGDISIHDRSVAVTADEKPFLLRTIEFQSPKMETLWFRALTGEIVAESEKVYTTPSLRLTIPHSQKHLRTVPENSSASELLLELTIPQGTSTIEIRYEPIQK